MAHASAHRSWLPRLAARFEPACWAGLVVRVVQAAGMDDGTTLHRTSDHYLGAAWAPPARGLSRWPEIVVIGSPAPDDALEGVFAHLPAEARLYLGSLDELDGILAAEILCRGDRNLEPYQRAGLEAFIAAERRRTQALVASRFTDHDPGFERFRTRVLNARPSP